MVGLIYILNEIKVEKVIIGKQFKKNENYENLIKIINEKKIELMEVSSGDKIIIENGLYFDILWPDINNEISENSINNNSLVCKLVYKNFSILFTGDIEKITENEILKKYKSNFKILNSTIIKIAHHGSKSSSSEEFLNATKPKIAVISVGEKNRFGHPSDITLENLKNNNCKIYRTDESGEISIKVNNKILINKKID